MYWLLKRSVYSAQKGEGNKAAMRARVDSGEMTGLLGYLDGVPVAWCAVQSRECYPGRRGQVARPGGRGTGVVGGLPLRGQALPAQGPHGRDAQERGQLRERTGRSIVEGYPVEPKSDNMLAAFAWTGVAAAYRKAGFVEVARRSEGRPIMRCFYRSPGTSENI